MLCRLEFETGNRYTGKLDSKFARLIGKYSPIEPESTFDFADVISLTALTEKFRKKGDEPFTEYYESCRSACEDALHIARNHLARKMDESDFHALKQLVRLRCGIINFQDEWGTLLEGDCWGTRYLKRVIVEDAPFEKLSDASRWYTSNANSLLKGIPVFDDAIASILNWNTSLTISFSELRSKFRFPDPEKFWDENLMP